MLNYLCNHRKIIILSWLSVLSSLQVNWIRFCIKYLSGLKCYDNAHRCWSKPKLWTSVKGVSIFLNLSFYNEIKLHPFSKADHPPGETARFILHDFSSIQCSDVSARIGEFSGSLQSFCHHDDFNSIIDISSDSAVKPYHSQRASWHWQHRQKKPGQIWTGPWGGLLM